MNVNRRIHILIKRRLPSHLRATPNIFFFSFSVSALMGIVPISIWFFWMGNHAGAFSTLLATGLIATALVLWRMGVRMTWCVCIYQLTLLGVVLFNAGLTGGVTSPALVWLAIVPLMPLFTTSRKWATAWMGISFLSVLTLYYLQSRGYWVSANIMSAPNGEGRHGEGSLESMIFGATMFSMMLLTQMILVQTYDTANEHHLRRLQRTNQRLQTLSHNLLVANTHKDSFLAMVSHEMRTPLNAVMGYLGLLATDAHMPPQTQPYVQGARNSASHLVTVINDLLDFSQIQQGKLILTKQAVNLHDLLTNTHQTLAPKAAQSGLSYPLTLTPSLPTWVLIDPHRLAQIILNLLGNALKFTTQGYVRMQASFETAHAQSAHGTLIICVEDSGKGIPSNHLEDIFEPFVQIKANDNRHTDNALHGNGLGLAITRSLVKSHQGSIQVQSTLGEGSRFTVRLPIEVATAPLARRNDDVLTDPSPFHLLVVDDHATNRLVVSATLMRSLPNTRIDQAANGTQALEKMRTTRYDLVLMDLIMPDISGVDVVRRIRQEGVGPFVSVPVVALTANVAADAVKECLDAGICAVLPKPFDREALVHAVIQHARMAPTP
ncbi:ATP-binding protein [Limnohabitans sp.]|uniref:ATP-binding protein n=1 Tax=Limnohabitans sp. TaxID=1907725 RepID=UPI00286EB865|nr:ATP-binding protein [Limnohabitans sp.]